MNEYGDDWTTVIHNSNLHPKKIASQTTALRSSKLNTSLTDDLNWPSMPKSSNPKRMEQPTQIRRDMPKPQQEPQEYARASQPTTHKLRGMKPEKGVALYLKNINIGWETDEEIGNMVKDHAKRHAIRIMSYKVMRYRACNDVVGCRIFVPQSMEQLALDPKMWPSEIDCRRWENSEVWKKKIENQRYTRRNTEYDYNNQDDNGYNKWSNKEQDTDYYHSGYTGRYD